MDKKKHIMSMLVDNKPGVLSRIVGLFSGRGYNIESLCVAPTSDPLISRVTLATKASDEVMEQIEKQVNKLINVIKVRDLSGDVSVHREMALMCIHAKPGKRSEILQIADIFRCKVVDTGLSHITLEATGSEKKIDALISLLKPLGIKKIARTGIMALKREPE